MSELQANHESNNGASLKVLCRMKTKSPPSCVEFSSINPDLFVVGTYTLLDGESQSRVGSLELYRVENDQVTLIDVAELDCAVLDLHFAPNAVSPDTFAIATSKGTIRMYQIKPSNGSHYLFLRKQADLFPSSTLVLSLAWHPNLDCMIGVTLSTGHVAIVMVNWTLDKLKVINESVISHGNNEAWTVAFSAYQSLPLPLTILGIYSGGDDCRLRARNLVLSHNDRVLVDEILNADGIQVAKAGFGGHEGGVTAILSLPLNTGPDKETLLTGSYDDSVRVYSVTSTAGSHQKNNGKVLATCKIGGGVWRLKFLRDYKKSSNPRTEEERDFGMVSFRVLASCMHAGVRVLEVIGRLEDDRWWIHVLAGYDGHDSMNYASDVQPIPLSDRKDAREDDDAAVCVSTSFYDNHLALWRFTKE